MEITGKFVLEVGDTVKDKSDSILFLVLCQSRILGESYCPRCLLLATRAIEVLLAEMTGEWWT